VACAFRLVAFSGFESIREDFTTTRLKFIVELDCALRQIRLLVARWGKTHGDYLLVNAEILLLLPEKYMRVSVP
jgi:hypothetical protein